MSRSAEGARVAGRLLHVALMVLAGVVFAYPMLFMFAAGFKPSETIFADLGSPTALIPDASWTLDNYRAMF